jgi:hypothetical protein
MNDNLGGLMRHLAAQPLRVGLMQYVRSHYREIMIMKGAGWTSKQIVDRLNGRIAMRQVPELRKAVTVGYFNKVWHEFCQRNNMSTKPSIDVIHQIEEEIAGYRDPLSVAKRKLDTAPQSASYTQETAFQLAELIKFILEILRQGTGGQAGHAYAGSVSVAEREEQEFASRRKTLEPVSPDLSTVDQSKLAAFFSDE